MTTLRRHRPLIFLAAVTAALAFAAASAGAQRTIGGIVTLPRDTIRSGDSLTTSAQFYNTATGTVATGSLAWSSSNVPVARFLAGSRLVGASVGCTLVRAKLGKAEAGRELCVIARPATPPPTPPPTPTPTPTPVPTPTPTPPPPTPTPVPVPTPTPPPVDTTPAPAGSPAPTLLPVAQPKHAMNVAAYRALNVPGMSAGTTYLDPVTGVRITKLTSSSFPGGGNWGHEYFEGGDEISLPYNGSTRAVKLWSDRGNHAMIDFTPRTGVSNARSFPSGLSPDRDLCFAFSTNPATPYYAYVLNRGTLRRLDIRTMTEAPGGGFPLPGAGDGGWLHQSANDGEFVWKEGSGPIHWYVPATGQHRKVSLGAVNEPRMSRSGRYVGMSMDSPQNGHLMWDAQSNTQYSLDGSIPFAHQATLSNFWVGSSWNEKYPFPLASWGITQTSRRSEWGPSIGDFPVWSGNWIQSGDQRNAWIAGNSYGSLSGVKTAQFQSLTWTAPGGIVLATANGERRLLAHPYSNQTTPEYWNSVWPKFSSDGRFVIFASDMLGSGRYDLFAAELPVKP